MELESLPPASAVKVIETVASVCVSVCPCVRVLTPKQSGQGRDILLDVAGIGIRMLTLCLSLKGNSQGRAIVIDPSGKGYDIFCSD